MVTRRGLLLGLGAGLLGLEAASLVSRRWFLPPAGGWTVEYSFTPIELSGPHVVADDAIIELIERRMNEALESFRRDMKLLYSPSVSFPLRTKVYDVKDNVIQWDSVKVYG